MSPVSGKRIYYSIGEIADMFSVSPSLIRYWANYFPQIEPHKNKKGNRLFTASDLEVIKRIYHLTKECGMKLEAVSRLLDMPDDDFARREKIRERLTFVRGMLESVLLELDEIGKHRGEKVVWSDNSGDSYDDSDLREDYASLPSYATANAETDVFPDDANDETPETIHDESASVTDNRENAAPSDYSDEDSDARQTYANDGALFPEYADYDSHGDEMTNDVEEFSADATTPAAPAETDIPSDTDETEEMTPYVEPFDLTKEQPLFILKPEKNR